MADGKIYEKDDKNNKVIIKETKTETRQSQYTIEEVKDIIANLQEQVTNWENVLQNAQMIGVKTKEELEAEKNK